MLFRSVEIDPETGYSVVVRYVIVDDFGYLLNPMLVEGQVHGGVVQGIGQAMMVASCLKLGAIFRVATDIEDYVRQTLEEVLANGNFEWLANSADDWRQPWDDWISTRYELKALREDRTPHYLTFRKI